MMFGLGSRRVDVRAIARHLRNSLQPLLGDERKQLERGAARMFLAALPLADETGCNIEISCEYRLTCLLAHADLPNLLGRQFLDWRQANFVERLHRPLMHDARLGETKRGLVYGRQRVSVRDAGKRLGLEDTHPATCNTNRTTENYST